MRPARVAHTAACLQSAPSFPDENPPSPSYLKRRQVLIAQGATSILLVPVAMD